MSWSDPDRRFEPAEDQELREELAGLLGLPAPRAARVHGARMHGAHNFFDAEPTPEIVALAEKLRAEADRRRHTQRRRPAWMLAAAVLPFMLVLAGIGSWGSQQKRRAEEAQARALKAEEERNRAKEQQRLTLEGTKAEIDRDREERQGFRAVHQASATGAKGRGLRRPAGAELVIPVDHPLRTPALDVQRVKAQGQPPQ